MVQKHTASHLHYDLRLELDGVLKSWAVPKGPSLNPAHKRLAVMVEDHPLEYAKFEGIIPEGNYGAGKVIVWDEGSYTPRESKGKTEDEKTLREQLLAGHLTFILQGKKLKGEFGLVKMSGREQNAWLLIKKNDRYASDRDVTLDGSSVLSQSTTIKKVEKKLPKPKINLSIYPKSEIPKHVIPMLATLVGEAFSKPGWLFEIKWDGYRAIAEIENGKVRLYSRHGLDFASKYPAIIHALALLPWNVVLDGEIVVLDETGKPDFQSLQNYTETGKGNLTYVVFDLLYIDGHDLTKQPLKERKKILKRIIPKMSVLQYGDHIEAQGISFFELARGRRLEGIMAKKADSPYQQGMRNLNWRKIKTHMRQEAVIAGFTNPRGSRTHFGSLILGVHVTGKFKYIGHTGGGFSDEQLETVYSKMKPLIQKECPFDQIPETNAPATWIKPILVCEIEFSEWTEEGLMRQPIFLGLRIDKVAGEVTREEPREGKFFGTRSPDERKKSEAEVKIGKQLVTLSHLDKVFWPKEGYTKGDLIEYYRQVSPILLPYLKDRPESLLRYPDGIEGENFYHKDVGELVPDWLATTKVHLESESRDIYYSLCQDEASLVYLINLGCIDLNPWNSRVGTEDKPDYAIIDLDPLDTPFEKVVTTAQAVREVLEAVEVSGYCKTSGARGIHIYLPLQARYSYESARTFCLLIATLVNRKVPEITSLERSPDKRQGKVYLDCFQNSRGQTLASAYCVRPVPGACVSTPLEWSEVDKSLTPLQFTIRNTMARLEKKGDLFKLVLDKGIEMDKVVPKLEELLKLH